MVGRTRAVFLGGVSLVLGIAVACGGSSREGIFDGADGGGGAGSGGEGGSAGAKPGGSGGAGGGSGGAGGGGSGGAPSGGSGGGSGADGGSGGGGTGSGGATGGSGGAGGTAGFITCANSLACASDALGRTICDASTKVCVECVYSTDCGTGEDCVRHMCTPYTACTNSLDCPAGEQVCDTSQGRCVECVGTNDCGDPALVCVDSECRTACNSDNQCTPAGELCDFGTGSCAECLTDAECASSEFCDGGECVGDVCVADTSFCSPGGVVTCSARGDTLTAAAPCGARSSCIDGAGSAQCTPWLCTPDATECSNQTTVVKCSSDGLSVLASTDCSATNQVCNTGACSDLLCQPSSDFCQQGTVQHCTADGLSSSLVDTCEGSEYCDPAAPSCKPLLCAPNAPACNSEVATTCNASGTGYTPGGTDCSNTGQTCVSGTCQTCSQTGPLDLVRLVEIFIYQNDYVVLENTSDTCPVELSGLTIRAADAEGSVDLTIAPFSLAPGARALVGESGMTTGADTTTNALINLNTAAGHVLLCDGPCTTAGTPTVIDAMSYWEGATAPPALPSPVTFTPVNGIPTSTQAYVRTAMSGTYPSFQQSDWTIGDATLPENTCPASQPVANSSCTAYTAQCVYGQTTCTCTLVLPLFGWVCN